MTRLWFYFFGCRHPRYSWPISVINGKRCEQYVVCITCGEQILYALGEGMASRWSQLKLTIDKGQPIDIKSQRHLVEG